MPQSHERAFELFKLSKAQGHAAATCNLAMGNTTGIYVDHSVAEARRLFELAMVRGETQVAPQHVQAINNDIQQHCPLLGQRVILDGLNTAALNETSGTAVDFGFGEKDPETNDWVVASGRYTVRLDGREGRLVKVRSANVSKAG